MQQYDVIVVGLGVMGSATLWQLAQTGARVLGLEAGGPAHADGSSHGATRIFRRAYAEGASYLPLLHLAHAGWQQLQSSCAQPLMIPTGGVFIGPRDSSFVAGSVNTAITGNIEHEHLDAAALRRRLPQFSIEDDMHALLEPGAYAVASEAARLQMLDEAVRCGAEIAYGAAVASIDHPACGLRITTQRGVTRGCKTAVVTTGAWISALIPELSTYLSPKRVPVYWFTPRPGCEAHFTAAAFPVFVYECSDGTLLYGIAAGASSERGVKIGFHNRQQLPWSTARPPSAPDDTLRAQIAHYVARIFPDLVPQPERSKWCIYTLSTDGSFVIGSAQHTPGVFYASACSGHGFKFAPAIGSVLASLALGNAPAVAIDAFTIERFQRTLVRDDGVPASAGTPDVAD